MEDLQNPPSQNQKSEKPKGKTKKFTFQSTVRQIERKRLAEKLSREAEQKEQQRLGELEAMRRQVSNINKDIVKRSLLILLISSNIIDIHTTY